jgi:hypothetical protein
MDATSSLMDGKGERAADVKLPAHRHASAAAATTTTEVITTQHAHYLPKPMHSTDQQCLLRALASPACAMPQTLLLLLPPPPPLLLADACAAAASARRHQPLL